MISKSPQNTYLDAVGSVGVGPHGRRRGGADGLGSAVGVEEGHVAVGHVAVQGVGLLGMAGRRHCKWVEVCWYLLAATNANDK